MGKDAGPVGSGGPMKPLTWYQFSSRGIQTTVAPDTWNAGHLDDVIPLANGAALVGSNTGGLWRVNENGQSLSLIPLSAFQAVLIWNQFFFNGTQLVADSGFFVSNDGGLTWTPPASTGLPKETLWGMAANTVGNQSTLYVSTDDKVFASADLGATWVSTSDNLQVRPHNADLRVVVENGKRAIYLSTFGRSMFRASLD